MAAAKAKKETKKEELPLKKDELLKGYLAQFSNDGGSIAPNQTPVAELAVYTQLLAEWNEKGYAPSFLLLGKNNYYKGKTDKVEYMDEGVVLVLQAARGPDANKFLAVKITSTNPLKWENSGWVSKEKLAEFYKPGEMHKEVGMETVTIEPGFPKDITNNPNTDKQFYKPLSTEFVSKAYLKQSDIPDEIRNAAKIANEKYVNSTTAPQANQKAPEAKKESGEANAWQGVEKRDAEYWQKLGERKAFVAFTLKPEGPQMLGYVAGRDKDGMLIVRIKEKNKLKRLFGKKVKDEYKVDELNIDKVFDKNVKVKDVKLEEKKLAA